MMDQTIKADGGKIRPLVVPTSLVPAVAIVREYGIKKYSKPDPTDPKKVIEEIEGWRLVEPVRYRNALYRHLLAYLDGEQYDLESKLPHTWHMATNASFLIELEDRPRW